MNCIIILILIKLIFSANLLADSTPKIVSIAILYESNQNDVPEIFSSIIKEIELSNRNANREKAIIFKDYYIKYDRNNLNDSQQILCQTLSKGISIFIDVTWTVEWQYLMELLSNGNIPYLNIDITIKNAVGTMTQYLQERDATEAVLIFQNELELDQGIYQLIEDSALRVVVFNGVNQKIAQQIKKIRPIPKYFSIFANTYVMNDIFKEVIKWKLIKHPDRWNLQFLDFNFENFIESENYPQIHKLSPQPQICCYLLGQITSNQQCECLENFQISHQFLKESIRQLINVFKQNFNDSSLMNTIDCNANESVEITRTKLNSIDYLENQISNAFQLNPMFKMVEKRLSINLNTSIYTSQNNWIKLDNYNDYEQKPKIVNIGTIENGKIYTYSNVSIKKSKRFFRIGITEEIPWVYLVRDTNTNETILDGNGQPLWSGYCIDLTKKLSEVMNFDYEFVAPKIGTFGNRIKNSHKWDGIIGDLMTGEIDIAVAPLKMTAEREEVMDFVAPYFEQTGILIVIRKPIRQTSLFKFMTVLRLEVWLSIIAALTATAIMIWLLDKYSPYSATNNKSKYSYPCRQFSLKESFWFSLTSFTPQGGGEVPKALSSRTLVAAYWLFVVLMLATFTANLAAFLTVERMQTPVQSLEQLARQSRINYTVVEGSDTHKYFINMKFAEDTMYRVWKEITLNSTSDQTEYRIWDYPIKEQYGHILLAINSSIPVRDAAEGFRKVKEHENADFALIHDSAEIKYELTKSCDLTQVGEVFGEQPYAIGIQQGSQLQDEISRSILELQRTRFLEDLTEKYWNHSSKGNCPNTDDSEGITLESLGGVFIATLFGLALAMITLVGEVIYYRRKHFQETITKVTPFTIDTNTTNDIKNPNNINTVDNSSIDNKGFKRILKKRQIPKNITFGTEFISSLEKQRTNMYPMDESKIGSTTFMLD